MSKRRWGWVWVWVWVLLSAPQVVLGAVGRTLGVGEVDDTGNAIYTIPIVTPPGTAGLTPQLAFTYSSSRGASPLGVGWGIAGLSRIERCPTIWASNGTSRNVVGTAADRFCLDGVQLKYVSGPAYGGAGTRYSTEIESFARITSQGAAGAGPAYFVVERKDGLIAEYGNTTNSRIEIGAGSTARVWAVNKIRDRAGNSILFNYMKDMTNGSYRIDTIQYTANAAQGISAPYQVAFLYESLPLNEVDTQFMAGAVIRRVTRMNRVEVTHNGTRVRRYALNFESVLASTQRSRLQSIQECAGEPLECLDATTFTYQNGIPGLSAAVATGINTVVPPLPMDVNGDGRIDVAFPSSATSGAGVWMVSFANADGSYATAVNTGVTNTNYGQAIPIDYNADGKDDMLVPISGGTWWVILGTDSGFSAAANTSIPANGAVDGRATTLDMSGDGLDDLVWYDNAAVYYRYRALAGTFGGVSSLPLDPGSQVGSAFGNSSTQFRMRNRQPSFNGDARKSFIFRIIFSDPEFPQTSYQWRILQSGDQDGGTIVVSQAAFNAPIKYVDINGDGQTDVVYPVSAGGAYRYRLSNGLGLGPELIGPALQSVNFLEASVLDWEGDGDQDLLARHNTTGELMLMRSVGEALQAFVPTGLTPSGGTFFVGDANGDGLEDLLAVDGANNLTRMLHAGVQPDLLDRATDGFGNYTDFNYATLSSEGTCYSRSAPAPAYPQRDFRAPIPIVCSTSANNGIGGAYTLSYQYYNASANLQGRGFEGFGAKRSQDSRNGLYAYQYFNLGFPYTGTLYQLDVVQPNNSTLISRVQRTWSTYNYGSGVEVRQRPYVGSASSQDYEVGGSFNSVLIRSTATTNTVDSATGTLTNTTTTVTEGNNANGLNAGASYTFRSYAPTLFNDDTNWCRGRPTRTQQINSHSLFGGAEQTRTLDTTWDGVHCRPTDRVIEPGNLTRQVMTALVYDVFGNPATQTVTPIGQAERITQFNWGTDGRYPRTLTNALSQVTSFDWWPVLGQLRSTTDPNGLSRTAYYDLFGRPTSEVAPDSTSTLIEYLPCDADCSGFAHTRYKIRSTLRDSAAGTIAQGFVLVDGLDRARRRASYALEGGLIDQLTEYDALGRVARSSTPHFHFTGSPVWTNFTYDVLDRQRQVSRDRTSDADSAASTNTFDFDGLTLTSTDPQGKVRVDTLDPLGQILRAVQASGTVDASTQSYDYDAFANLVRTTDGMGNQVVIGYDVRGFKISSNDPDLGNWTYDYFPSGELKRQTDAKSQETTFTYDKLSRPLTRVEPADSGSGMQTTSWTWGTSTAAFNLGQLQSIAVGSYSETYSYDNRSRLSSTTVVAEGGTYVLSQSYNATTGRLETITYPASTGATPFKVKYEYETANKSGLLQRVKDFNAGTVFWQAVSSNALGQYQDVTLGNGLKTLTAFDSVTGATNLIETGPSGGHARQHLQYVWDKLGNLTSRQDLNLSKLETFTYDNLYRMTQASVTGGASLTVAYNALGNITSKSDVGSYTYDPVKKHAVTSAGSYSFTYDANGNAITQNGATLSWTAYNLPKLINQAGGNQSYFLYGPDRQRYKHVAVNAGTTETTIYVGGIFEKLTRNGTVEYKHSVVGPEAVVAIHNRKSTGVNETIYPLQDHLGSTDVVTDAAGASLVKLSFTPFGARRNGATWSGAPSAADLTAISNTTRRGFTDHEQLDNLGLIHMNGRVYHPVVGRFISADPFVQAPFNSQSLNRYSYVFNNPLSFTDPSGFFCGTVDNPCTGADVLGTRGNSVTIFPDGRTAGQREFILDPGQLPSVPSLVPGLPKDPVPTTGPPGLVPTKLPGSADTGGEGFMSTVGGKGVVLASTLAIPAEFLPSLPSLAEVLGALRLAAATTGGIVVGVLIPNSTVGREEDEIPGPAVRDALTVGAVGALAIAAPTQADINLIAPLIANAKSSQQFPFVVRLQAQGGGLERSVPLAANRPITAAEGVAGLAVLGSLLSKKQLAERAVPFARALRFIGNAAKAGGVGPDGGSFSLPGPAGIRVDVEVKSGTNFPR